MESEEETYRDGRAKRQIRPPVRLQDYEVAYMGYPQRDVTQRPSYTFSPEARHSSHLSMATFPSLPAPRAHPDHCCRDAPLHETPELAPAYFSMTELCGASTECPSLKQHAYYVDPDCTDELRVWPIETRRSTCRLPADPDQYHSSCHTSTQISF